jgi:iron uptake system component EfeO
MAGSIFIANFILKKREGTLGAFFLFFERSCDEYQPLCPWTKNLLLTTVLISLIMIINVNCSLYLKSDHWRIGSMKFTRILIIFALITALGLTACSNGKTAPSNKGGEAAAGQGGGGAAAAEPKAATEQMMQASDQLKELLQGGKTDQAAKKAVELEDQWSTFEDGIKPKYPDLYVKVEKYLSPLVSGAKQNPIDKDAMLKTNADLHSALAELSAALGGGKAAVEDKVLAASQELQKATEQYNQYVQEQGKQLVSALEALDKAIKSGDLAQAQQAYLQARLPYERIEPVIETFKDLDAVMDARVDDFKSEQDPEFTGFHRIEHILFVLKTTKEAEPFAARLLEDGKKMRDSIAAAKIETADFVTGVGELMEEAQSKKITGEEERWRFSRWCEASCAGKTQPWRSRSIRVCRKCCSSWKLYHPLARFGRLTIKSSRPRKPI